MNRLIRIGAAVFLSILISCGAVLAEDPPPAPGPTRPWTDSADFGFVLTSGNSENFNISFTNKFVYKWSRADLTIDAAALRTESTTRTLANDTAANTVVVTDTETVTAEMYAVGGKYTHKIKEKFYWFAAAAWLSNEPAGIDSRYGGGGGLGYRILESEVHTLAVELGVDYTQETQISGFEDSFAGASAFLGYVGNFAKTSKFTQDLTIRENLDDTDDLRAVSVSAVTASLSQKLALKVSLTLLYDNQPVVVNVAPVPPATLPAPFEYEKLDTILTAALVVNF